MNKELLMVVDLVANEKDIDVELVFDALEEALAMATRKKYNNNWSVKVSIDRESGAFLAKRLWTIVDEDFEIENYDTQLYVDVANEKGHTVEVGDVISEAIEAADFGRISAQAAKQIITQKVRKAERMKLLEKIKVNIGKIVYGTVKRVSREFLIVDIGDNAEGLLPRNELLPREIYRVNDKVRACLVEIDPEAKGHQIFLSRTNSKMVTALFALEVPEINEEMIDLVAIARDAGSRTKVAVKTNDKRMDPVGACVGMRGSRIQAIIDELQGEKIDIVLWDEDPVEFVMNALAPAKPTLVTPDDCHKVMNVAVAVDQLAQCIGKNGQNVRLASKLTGWTISVISEVEAEEQQQKSMENIMSIFIEALDVDSDIAQVLVEEGFADLETLAHININEIAKIDGFDEEIAEELQSRAKTGLLTKALLKKKPADDLLNMSGMTKVFAFKLAENNILTMEDLAELSTEDVLDILNIDKPTADNLIITARAPWFVNNENN